MPCLSVKLILRKVNNRVMYQIAPEENRRLNDQK
jgi:hypothetical protein